MVSARELTVGKRYRVEFRDCCVNGELTGELQEIIDESDEPHDDDYYSVTFVFDSGKIEYPNCGNYIFHEIGADD